MAEIFLTNNVRNSKQYENVLLSIWSGVEIKN